MRYRLHSMWSMNLLAHVAPQAQIKESLPRVPPHSTQRSHDLNLRSYVSEDE